jgi:hypothetical protein
MSWLWFRVLACLVFFGGATLSEAGMTPKRTVLSNGMVLLTSEQRTLPMVSIELLMDAGSVHEKCAAGRFGQLDSEAVNLRNQAAKRAPN